MLSTTSMCTANRRQQTWSNQHQLRKQRSFIESTAVASRILCQVGDSTGGNRSRANRSCSLILARTPSERNKLSYLQKQRSVADQVRAGIRGRSEYRAKGYSLITGGDRSEIRRVSCKDAVAGGGGGDAAGIKLAWGNSTFDSVDKLLLERQTSKTSSLLGSTKKDATTRSLMGIGIKKTSSCASSKPENKINLSIVLSQTIKATEIEVANSDIDSSSESVETAKISQKIDEKKTSPAVTNSKPQEIRLTSAAQRRAQFQSSRVEQIFVPSPIQTIPSNTVTLNASPSLTIQQRPPLVRAMSAPVRSLDNTTKNILANNKRKTRRRRIITRNSSCDKGETEPIVGVSIGANGKKVLSRSKSTIASDVITLVSLISSEGSDSEKEDSTSLEETQSGRAPSLRKTGKSVSFQENDHEPNYQMVVKEFPHILRRGSIAPLAARLRSNRPPTAPPVSIFLSDYENCTVKMSELEKITSKDDLSHSVSGKENNIYINGSASRDTVLDCDFPEYVRSKKERECWRLFQKMSNKGVTVAYDTILRGMLTPTEFRQLQKQRDFENAKAKEAEEAEALVNVENKIQGLGRK